MGTAERPWHPPAVQSFTVLHRDLKGRVPSARSFRKYPEEQLIFLVNGPSAFLFIKNLQFLSLNFESLQKSKTKKLIINSNDSNKNLKISINFNLIERSRITKTTFENKLPSFPSAILTLRVIKERGAVERVSMAIHRVKLHPRYPFTIERSEV